MQYKNFRTKIVFILAFVLVLSFALCACTFGGWYTLVLVDGGNVTTQLFSAGEVVVLPVLQDTSDKTFGGWYANQDFSGERLYILTATENGSAVLFAKWENAVNPGQYFTVQFNANGGNGAMQNLIFEGETAILPLCAFTRTGYDFVGWATSANDTAVYQNGATFTRLENGYDTTLFAVWAERQVPPVTQFYTITFNTDGGSSVSPATYEFGAAVTSPANPTKDGYTFKGWNPSLPATMPNHNLTVTAVWEKETGNFQATAKVSDWENANNTHVKLLDELAEENDVTYGIKSVGTGKALIIPVTFTNCKVPKNMVSTLNTAFFGDSDKMDWESLASYYYKSSYGKLSVTGTVLDVFNTGKRTTYYESIYNDGDDPVQTIIESALAYYDSTVDFSEYDGDGDGNIDAIYIVYTASVNYDDDDSMWWAYTSECVSEKSFDGVRADYYFFAGYEFVNDEVCLEWQGNAFTGGYVGKTIDVNTETFVHETGHILGLDDYYDFDDSTGPDGGIGGGDMMDYNVGDHNAFSKTILGWTDPIVVNGTTSTLTLRSFGATGDCLIIAKNWNGSYFEEYYIVDFYTPDGLNQLEAGYSGLFTKSGVRVYHIDATPNANFARLSDEDRCIWSLWASNNGDTAHKLISLVQADGSNSIEDDNALSQDTDLFQAGDSFDWATWYDGTDAGFVLTVDSVTNGIATVTVTF